MADDFGALSKDAQSRIDAAFDAAISSHSSEQPLRKRRKLNPTQEPDAAGGFLVDDAPGGFIPPSEDENDDPTPAADDAIPLSLIPAALQILDLPPDDEEVLQVFHNAAGGWSGTSTLNDTHGINGNSSEHGVVSRNDWRAVCAVVLGGHEDEAGAASGDPGGGFPIDNKREATFSVGQSVGDIDDIDEEDASVDDDAYEDFESGSSLSSFSDTGGQSDSDSYQAGPSKTKQKSKANRARIHPEAAGVPTLRQKKTALEAYALFFAPSPSISEEELMTKRLTYKDVVRVAEVLKEKIKADEIKEMLSVFSTSADASMSFEDFTRMVIKAKLA